jgi:hypothetical protein
MVVLKFGILLKIVYNNISSDFGGLEKWQAK